MIRAILLLAGLLLRPAGAQPEPLLWPLDVVPTLSSTFGETRATAFHNGIDLKVWGKTGYPVRAIADGWILQARTSPWGYGRVLYQQLEDGRIVVYAHLAGVFDAVQERITVAQRQTRQYTTRLWFQEAEIPVRRGQVIAHSGKSGAGPPHLHVEIRSADNVPLNPLREGLGPVADTTPPTLRQLLVVPLDASSLVDGEHDPVRIAFSPGEGGVEARQPVQVWGRIGLAVDAYDRADLATNKMSVWRFALDVDGHNTFTSTYERVSFADGHLVALDRLHPEPDLDFNALFRRPGNRLSFYQAATPEGDGTLQAGGNDGSNDGLAPGPHEVIIRGLDLAGNETRARLQLVVSAPPRVVAARLTQGQGGALFLEADFIDEDDERLTVVIAAASTAARSIVEETSVVVGAGPFTWVLPARQDGQAWSVTARDGAGNSATQTLAVPRLSAAPEPLPLDVTMTARTRHVVFRVVSPRPLQKRPEALLGTQKVPLHEGSPGNFTGVLPLDGIDADSIAVDITAVAVDGGAGQGRLVLSGRAIRPGEAHSLGYLQGTVVLHTAAESAFEVLYPQVTDLQPETTEELMATAVGCEISPADAAFDGWARLSMRADGPQERLGVYADDGKGRWVFIGNNNDGDGFISARIRAFGRFALLQDHQPPTITNLQPDSGSVVDGDVLFSASVTDGGSGIKREEDVVLELDGVRLIAEYDPEAERVTAAADQPMEAGAHHLVLTLRDAVGNETVATTDFISR